MRILDMSAGNRAIWFNKHNPLCKFIDIRPEVNPELVMDSTNMDFHNDTFDLIVFDPPHVNAGRKSDLSHYYGHHTTEQIRTIIKGSGKEAHRVSKSNALMAFKWGNHDMKLNKVLDLMPNWEPLFGHLTRNGPTARSQTYWCMLRRLP